MLYDLETVTCRRVLGDVTDKCNMGLWIGLKKSPLVEKLNPNTVSSLGHEIVSLLIYQF